MNRLIDSHTHSSYDEANSINILNIDFQDIDQIHSIKSAYSFGLHPWHIDEKKLESFIKLFPKVLKNSTCIGLGEIGLDRIRGPAIELQVKALKIILDLAQEIDVQVIVFHCVRAFSDLLPLLKNYKAKTKFIFHDYNGNVEITKELNRFSSFFSFGDKLFRENSKGFQSMPFIPRDRLLLESDDNTDLSIEMVYHRAGKVLAMEQQDLIQLLRNNNSKCFGEKIEQYY